MITDIAARLVTALRAAGVAIISVSVGDPFDRTTWTVQPAALQAAAQPILDAFVEPTPTELGDEEALRDVDLKVLKAMVIEIHAAIPAWAGKPTLVQLRDNILARYKIL